MAWTRPSVQGPAPSARCAHTTTAVDNQRVLFIFGGWNGTTTLNDLQVFHHDAMTWSKPITTGAVPGVRVGHTCTVVASKLYVFGGGDGNHYLNDLHILNTETMEWSQAYVAGTSPASRSRHTCVAVGSKLYVFGGGDDSRVYNDLYVLDTDTMSWSRPVPKGTAPTARWGHTCTYIGDSKLLVLGGHDGTKMLNDINILDTNTMTWIPIAVPAKNPEGQPNTGPSARAGHTATLVRKMLLVFGGGDGSKILNDTWFLDLTTFVWSKPQVSGTAPAGRSAHTTNLIDDKLIVFGGGDGSRRFKDLYILDIEQVMKAEESRKSKVKKGVNNKPQQKKTQGKGNEEPKIKGDISTWLTGIGMKKYTESFVSQEIDMDTLPFLTETHLEQLGVTTVGARLRILAAAKALQESEAEAKESDLIELAQTLKESMDTLTSSTNRLTEALKNQGHPPLNGYHSPVIKQNGFVKHLARPLLEATEGTEHNVD